MNLIKESVLVVGLGEIGRPLFELIVESKKFIVFGLDTKKEKMLAFISGFSRHR